MIATEQTVHVKLLKNLQQKTKEYDWLVITRITGFLLVLMKV